MCICHYFNYYLPDFITAISLGFFGFSVWSICFNRMQCHNKPLVESSFLIRDQAKSLWSRSTDSKTLDYQKTNPGNYQIVRTHTKENHLNTRHLPTTSSNLCRKPHVNNKQNKIQSQSSADRITSSPSLTHQRKKKQTSKQQQQQKLSTNLSLYEAYTNH